MTSLAFTGKTQEINASHRVRVCGVWEMLRTIWLAATSYRDHICKYYNTIPQADYSLEEWALSFRRPRPTLGSGWRAADPRGDGLTRWESPARGMTHQMRQQWRSDGIKEWHKLKLEAERAYLGNRGISMQSSHSPGVKHWISYWELLQLMWRHFIIIIIFFLLYIFMLYMKQYISSVLKNNMVKDGGTYGYSWKTDLYRQ